MKRILVTGGFGFVGSHLVEALLEDSENTLHVVDNLVTSPIDVPSYLAGLKAPDRLSYDLCSIQDYLAREPERRFDEIYHLASIVGPVGVLSHAGRIVEEIVGNTYRLASLAKAQKVRLCDISTSEVYGGGRDGYCSERDSKIIPPRNSVRLEYAVAKLACEVALMNMATIGELDVVIVRPFNIAGPRQSPKGGFVLPRFLLQALQNEDLTVYGDGRMIRAFTHVKDIVDGIIRAQRKGISGEAYNLGDPANKTTILELAQRVLHLTGSRSRLAFVDPKQLFGPLFEEANDKYPDADRAKTELGWKPAYGIDQIIEGACEYIRDGRRD